MRCTQAEQTLVAEHKGLPAVNCCQHMWRSELLDHCSPDVATCMRSGLALQWSNSSDRHTAGSRAAGVTRSCLPVL